MRKPLTLGFTLIEVMVTVAIVAILAAVALPSYEEFILRSRRAEGKTELIKTQQLVERAFTDLNNYGSAIASVANASGVLPTSEHGYYRITSTPAPASTVASTYTLNSVPQTGQAKDRCKTLTITETGAKGVAATAGVAPTATAAECW